MNVDKNLSRREFLGIGAKAVLALTAITACGDLVFRRNNSSAWAQAKVKPEEIIVGEDNFIANIDLLKEKKALGFVYKGKKSILLYNDGKIKAFENICTHKGGPSKLDGNKLTCQWHGATFDPLTGEAISGPAPKGSKLKEINLVQREEKIFIEHHSVSI